MQRQCERIEYAVQQLILTLNQLVLFSLTDNNPADKSLKWIIDLTIAYPGGKPLDIFNIFFASAPPCNTVFHYRCYPVSEVT